MKKLLLFAVLMSLAATAYAADDQAYLGIFVETQQQKMIGMPAMPKMPELPAGFDPAMLGGMAGMFGPKRTVTVRLWSPGIAPASASAVLAVPTGLKQGKQLVLDLYRPKPGQTTAEEPGTPGEVQTPSGQFTIKRYWGSSRTVKPGQPLVTTFKWGSMTAEQKEQMSKARERASAGYFYKPDWTTGYWPTKKQPGQIAKGAALPGNYSLTTTYTGNVAIDVPANVDFLAPIDLTSPELDKAPALTEAIDFKWDAVPNVIGYHATIFGMVGQNTIIMWSSSEVPTGFDVDWDFMQMAEARQRVKATELMAGDRTEVIVPAGIFKDCDTVSFMMIGYGPGAALAQGQPLPRVQTKTTLTMPLGGKMMEGMMEGMGGDEEEKSEDEGE